MGSRREEERNEKIIRGLMKLPPNRRCINCNSLGPQYVCINFWTFVCMTCSGIHREFTHRVKSVSMSKFTSQEVEALQAGGNQRAREIYLKSWDLQRQRLPDNSNVEKVREFIKSVYVEKKFAGGSIPSKPPRDLQSTRSLDNETRRASSYHSYSQSPPYDFQYEDRLYGKHGATLTRKPGSDRGIYAGKMASYIFSPTRFNEDGLANEGSVPRFSDYSASSVGDPFSSGAESPSFQKDIGCASPVQRLKDTLAEGRMLNLFAEAKAKRDTEFIHHPQRTMSSGSVGTLPFKSGSSNPEPLIDAVRQLDNMANSSPSAASWTNGTMDFFEAPVGPPSDAHATAMVDLFQFPGAPPPPSTNLFQAVTQSQVSSTDGCSPSQTPVPSSSGPFCGYLWQPLVSPFNKELVVEPSGPVNEGWANFDSPPPATSMQGPPDLTTAVLPSSIGSSMVFDITSAQTMEMQWPQLQNFGPPESSLIFDSWKEPLQNLPSPIEPIDTQAWNAFNDHSSSTMLPLSIRPIGEPQSAADDSMPVANQHSVNLVLQENTDNNVAKDAAYEEFEFPVHAVNVDFSLGAAYLNPLLKNSQSDATSHKSANPFDLPFDSEVEAEHMFLDMSSLQAALPISQLPATFIDEASQQWFPPDPVPSYMQTAAAQGGLAYMVGQAPTTKLGNIQPEGPVASIGRNPFD